MPAEVQSEVAKELALIDAHAGILQSAVMGIGGKEFMEDYGQYVPRGHYTLSEDLKRYFRAMMWYGPHHFPPQGRRRDTFAVLLTQALNRKTQAAVSAADLWAKIYEPTSFFVGGADDLTYRDYAPADSSKRSAPTLLCPPFPDDAKMAQFQAAWRSRWPGRASTRCSSTSTEDKETSRPRASASWASALPWMTMSSGS